MYKTLFPLMNASPYLFLSCPLTYSCLSFWTREGEMVNFGTFVLSLKEENKHNNFVSDSTKPFTTRVPLCVPSQCSCIHLSTLKYLSWWKKRSAVVSASMHERQEKTHACVTHARTNERTNDLFFYMYEEEESSFSSPVWVQSLLFAKRFVPR